MPSSLRPPSGKRAPAGYGSVVALLLVVPPLMAAVLTGGAAPIVPPSIKVCEAAVLLAQVSSHGVATQH